MNKIHRYTLIAAQRGNFRRGASVTVPAGSSRDLELAQDPAWRVSVMADAAPGPAVTRRSTGLYQSLVSFLQQHATQVATLTGEDREAYTRQIEAAREHLQPLFLRSVGLSAAEIAELQAARAELDEASAELADAAAEVLGDDDQEPEPGEARGGPDVDAPEAAANARADLQAALDAVAVNDRAHTIPELVELATAAGLELPDPLPRTKADLVGLITDLLVG